MATITKDFRIKAGLVVEGATATVEGHDVLTKKIADAKGDLLVGTADNAISKLTVGQNNYILTADSSETTGVKWAAPQAVGVFNTEITFEGATADAFETTLTVVDPTADRTITLPDATGTVALTSDITVTESSTTTLSNKSISLTTNTVTGTIAEFNTALSDQDFATLAGTETFTNKTLTSPKINEDVVMSATATELNVLDGITSTTAELNILDGVTSTAAELNILDGATLTVTELNYVDGVTSSIQTQLDDKSTASKTETLTNKTLTSPKINEDVALTATATELNVLDGITSSTAELNLLDGVTATTTELNYVDGVTSAIQTQLDNKLALAGGTMSGAIAMGTNKITGLGTPTDATDAATKAYVDSAAQGIDWKASVRAATTADGYFLNNFAAGEVLDGVTLVEGNRILIKNQTDASSNGIYTVNGSGTTPTRATDADSGAEVTSNFAVFVEEGTVNADSGWVLTNNGAVTVGTTELVFTQFTGLGQVTAGTGLDKTGNTLDIDSTVVTLTGTQTLTNKTLTSPVINTPTGITKSDVGLANVDNTTDANKPVSTATQTALDLKANLASPTFTGTVTIPAGASISGFAPLASPDLTGVPTAPTAAADTNTTQIATTAFAKAEADAAQTAAIAHADALTTSDVAEGTSEYFTDARAKASAAALLTGASKTNITITGTGAGLTITAENGVGDSTTTDLAEGTNLYFTNARAVSALEAVVPKFTAVELNAVAKQVAATLSAPTAGSQVAHSFAKASYRSAEYLVKVAYGTHTEISKVLLTLDTSDNIAITEYGTIGTNGASMTISAGISGANVQLLVTTANNNSTVTVMGTLLV
jgi:hypothetical protein